MSNSRAINAYPDIYQALGHAWSSRQETILKFPDEKAALKFVGRCGSFRRLNRKEQETSEFDALRISREGNVVKIIPWAETLPVMYNAAGEIIDLTPQYTRQEMDDMVKEERGKATDKLYVQWARTTNPKTGPSFEQWLQQQARRQGPDLTVLQNPGTKIFDD